MNIFILKFYCDWSHGIDHDTITDTIWGKIQKFHCDSESYFRISMCELFCCCWNSYLLGYFIDVVVVAVLILENKSDKSAIVGFCLSGVTVDILLSSISSSLSSTICCKLIKLTEPVQWPCYIIILTGAIIEYLRIIY